MWKEVTGYKFRYRVSDMGIVEKFDHGKWVRLRPVLSKKWKRAMVNMRTAEGKRKKVPIVWLVADAFMGGRGDGKCIFHKDGTKMNCAVYNLEFRTRSECSRVSGFARRKAVLKIAPDGEVVKIYRSLTEAAKGEFVIDNAICERCRNKVKNPFKLTGYNYQYER